MAVENGFGSIFVLNGAFWFGFFVGGRSLGGQCCTKVFADAFVHLLDGDGRQTRADKIGVPVDCQRGHTRNQAGEAAIAVLKQSNISEVHGIFVRCLCSFARRVETLGSTPFHEVGNLDGSYRTALQCRCDGVLSGDSTKQG